MMIVLIFITTTVHQHDGQHPHNHHDGHATPQLACVIRLLVIMSMIIILNVIIIIVNTARATQHHSMLGDQMP